MLSSVFTYLPSEIPCCNIDSTFCIIWLFTMITLLSLSPGRISTLLLVRILCISLKVLSLVSYTFWDNKSVVCYRNSWNSSFCSGVKHLPNNIKNILWKFELEMFCWTLDISRSVSRTFLVPRPYFHAECEHFSLYVVQFSKVIVQFGESACLVELEMTSLVPLYKVWAKSLQIIQM